MSPRRQLVSAMLACMSIGIVPDGGQTPPEHARVHAVPQDTSGVRRALDAQRAAFERAIAANDAAAMAATYAPHALLFPPSGDTIRGREAVRRAFDRTRDYTIRHDVVELEVRTGTAYEIGRWTQIGKRDGAVKGGGWYFWVWRRQPNGAWLIDRELWSSQPPGD
jgi:ketosteroid isomerase-like protein